MRREVRRKKARRKLKAENGTGEFCEEGVRSVYDAGLKGVEEYGKRKEINEMYEEKEKEKKSRRE